MERFFSQHPEILDRLHDAVISIDEQGNITACNLAAISVFAYPKEELVGLNINTLYSPAQLPRMQEMLERVRMNGSSDGEFLNRKRDGREVWVHLSVSSLDSKAGLPHGFIMFANDISERKAIEAEILKAGERAMVALRRAERQAAAARMGSALAHEINNPLASLTNVLYLLKMSEFGLAHQDLMLAADESLERVTRITRQMIGLSSESEAISNVNVGEIVDDTLAAYQSTIRTKRLRVQRRIDLQQERFLSVESDLRKLIASLVENAVEHAPRGSSLKVHVYPAVDWSNSRRSGIKIVVQDGGPGIPRELLPEIFDAFYSTKATRGSGLGLWASRSIAEKHGGRVKVRSSTRTGISGTCISVFLPLRESVAASFAAAAGQTVIN
jgi:PAS domain S-box-containing protein